MAQGCEEEDGQRRVRRRAPAGHGRPVIKAHGSSKAKAIKNAIRQARLCVESDLVGTMTEALAALEQPKPEENA